MEIALDRFGRIVIPKSFREGLGLQAGTRLKIEEQEGRIVLTVHRDQPDLVREDGVLVYTGEAVGDLEEAVALQRGRRLESAAGWQRR